MSHLLPFTVRTLASVKFILLLLSLLELKDNGTTDMSTIIKKLQDISGNRRFFIIEEEKTLRLLLFAPCHKCRKTYLRSTMVNNLLHALMLMHVHKSILNNINLADIAN